MNRRDTDNLCHYVAPLHAVIRRFATATAAILVLALVCFAPAASAHARGCAHAHSSIRRTSRRTLDQAVVCLVNQQRRSHHLPNLAASSRLNRSAQGWTNAMVSHRYFSHGADFAARISAVGFHWSNAGENIATGYGTPAAVVRAWMASTGHCQNILSPTFRYVGTGVDKRAIHGRGATWTQDFGLGMGQRPASGNWGPADGCPYR
jgi:uncharacterized protein YkwD